MALPEELIEHIVDLAQPTIAELRTFCLVGRTWLHPGRSQLFSHITVLAQRSTHNAKCVPHDEREIALYPRYITASTFAWLVDRAPHLFSLVRVLKISDDGAVFFLQTVDAMLLRTVHSLWLTGMTFGTCIDICCVLRGFSGLRELRVQEVHHTSTRDDEDNALPDRDQPVSVVLLGHVSPHLTELIVYSSQARLVDFAPDLRSHQLDAIVPILERHACNLKSLILDCGYLVLAPNDKTLKEALAKCTALVSLTLTNVRAANMTHISVSLANTVAPLLRYLAFKNVCCVEAMPDEWDLLMHLVAEFAAKPTLREIELEVKACVLSRECAALCIAAMPMLTERCKLRIRLSERPAPRAYYPF